MRLHILDLDVGDFGPDLGNAGIRNDYVKMLDTMACKLFNGIGGVGGDGGVNLDEEKRGTFGLGQVEERFGCWMVGVALSTNDRVVRFGEVELEKTLTKASVGAGNQHDLWYHDVFGS